MNGRFVLTAVRTQPVLVIDAAREQLDVSSLHPLPATLRVERLRRGAGPAAAYAQLLASADGYLRNVLVLRSDELESIGGGDALPRPAALTALVRRLHADSDVLLLPSAATRRIAVYRFESRANATDAPDVARMWATQHHFERRRVLARALSAAELPQSLAYCSDDSRSAANAGDALHASPGAVGASTHVQMADCVPASYVAPRVAFLASVEFLRSLPPIPERAWSMVVEALALLWHAGSHRVEFCAASDSDADDSANFAPHASNVSSTCHVAAHEAEQRNASASFEISHELFESDWRVGRSVNNLTAVSLCELQPNVGAIVFQVFINSSVVSYFFFFCFFFQIV